MKKLDDVDFEDQPDIENFLSQYICPYKHVGDVRHVLNIAAWQVRGEDGSNALKGHDLHVVCNCGFASAKVFEPIDENHKREAIDVFLNGALFLG